MNHENKSVFREKALQNLKKYSTKNKLYKDKNISKNILKIIKKEKAKNILLYLPLKIEVDIRLLIQLLRKKNYNIFVPFMIGNSFKVVPFRLPLKKKKYNILEPKNSILGNRFNLDLAIVPIVGLDFNFRRIGFGSGFYDRFFGSLRDKPKIIFTQIYLNKSDAILCEEHDIIGDFVVTNKGIMNE